MGGCVRNFWIIYTFYIGHPHRKQSKYAHKVMGRGGGNQIVGLMRVGITRKGMPIQTVWIAGNTSLQGLLYVHRYMHSLLLVQLYIHVHTTQCIKLNVQCE